MKNKWLATVLNFFLPGLGTAYIGKRLWVGVFMTLGALLLAYVEFNLKEAAPELYNYSFAGFLLLAIGTAMDAYHEAQEK